MRIIFIIFSLILPLTVFSQVTSVYTDADNYFEQGMYLFDKGNYGNASSYFQKSEKKISFQFDERSELLRKKAQFMHAKCALNGGLPDGEKLILNFYESHRPDPLAYLAIKEIANIYYEQRQYLEAIDYYNRIDEFSLSKDDKVEVLFKKGYCYFVKKDFDNAKRAFNPIIGVDSEYYYPTFYYSGMVDYFQGDYSSAVEHFFKLENFGVYQSRIPYYVSQIYFAQKEYEKLISYIPTQLETRGLKNKKEIRHILGQTYFIQNLYTEALPHLEFYESNSKKMRKEDFYQLAFTQYKLGLYDKAANNFKELSRLDSELGQISNHYLADCYLKVGKKDEARVSFKNVTNYNFDPFLEEEALFNYGKLSAELGYDRAAIKSLISLPNASINYNEAQNVLASLFESSKDYTMVISTIESMNDKAPKIKEAYQKVCLERGVQLIKDGLKGEAKQILQKGAASPINHYYSAIIYYYLADLNHQAGQYEISISYLNKYFTLHSIAGALPENASKRNANYIQGYNFLKLTNYRQALTHFDESLASMLVSGYNTKSNLDKVRFFADVVSRIGDCHFVSNRYSDASKHYKMASEIEFPGQDYALFQMSMIKGLEGKHYEKLVLLENLIKKVPNSSFIDDSYFQLGETQFLLENSRAAELSYLKILELKGKTSLMTRALLKLGLIAYNKGDVTKATNYYTSVLTNNPTKKEAQESLIALEEIYIQDLGQAEQFMEIVEKNTGYKLSSLEKDSLSYMAAQGRFDNGEYIEAIESYTRYIKNHPNGINRLSASFNRAESNTMLQNYELALPDYEFVVSLGQSKYYEDAVYKSALISYNDLKKFNKAFKYYNLLENITGDELLKYEAQVGALRSSYRAGDLDAVIVMSNKVNKNKLANKGDKALANFYAGKMNYVIKDWENALANLNAVVELVDNENAAESKFLINQIHWLKGDFEKAEELALETISNSTAYPFWVAKNLILLSDIFMEKQDIFNAKAALEAVIENFPETDDITSEAKDKLKLVLEEEAKQNRIEEAKDNVELDTIGRNE